MSSHFSLLCLFALLAMPTAAHALDWLPVSVEDRAATESRIDPDAGAEILYRVVQHDNSTLGEALSEEYVRVKVYNEKGVRRVAKTEVACDEQEFIDRLDARVIKPDGTIINVDKKSFFDRKVIKFGDMSVQVRAFSFPQLAPGDIAEYRWTKVRERNLGGARLYFQKDMPARHVVFRIKPLPNIPGWRTVAFTYGRAQQNTKLSPDGYNCLEMHDVPAYAIEPHGPPPNDMQSWMLFYVTDSPGEPESYWKRVGREAAGHVERHAKKPAQSVREKAASLTENVPDTVGKLARLNDYCRQAILNVLYFAPTGGADRKKILEERRSPDELIKSGFGNSRDIPILFIAMARSLGLDARLVLAANWNYGIFRKEVQSSYYLGDHLAAVKVDDGWRFYDPARCRVSTGVLHWQNEGNMALIASPKSVEWVVLPVTPAIQSLRKRTARLRVDEEGTLSGTVTIEYAGQSETLARYDFYKKEPSKIHALVRRRERSRIPTIEVARARVSDANDLSKPMRLTYSVKISGYAEKAGSRLFIQPAFFEKGARNMFDSETRVNNIFFQNNVATEDDVTIKVPDGYRLEEGSSPPSPGEANWGHFKVTMAFKKSTNEIVYKRAFAFKPRIFPAEHYKAIKSVFDFIHAQDAHILTLRAGAQEEAGG